MVDAVEFPIWGMWGDIAASQDISFREFNEKFFLPDTQKETFPHLADLSIHLAYPYGLGIEVVRDGMMVFEGSNGRVDLAYFGREVREYSGYTMEQGLINVGGRRVYVELNENGRGIIKVEDKLTRRARGELSEDSFGSSFDSHVSAEYGFNRRISDPNLPGVRAFLDCLIAGK